VPEGNYNASPQIGNSASEARIRKPTKYSQIIKVCTSTLFTTDTLRQTAKSNEIVHTKQCTALEYLADATENRRNHK
jgi:hypothetical protein